MPQKSVDKGDFDFDPTQAGLVWSNSSLRRIWIFGTIDESVAVHFHIALSELEAISKDDITIFVNSAGGYLNSCHYIIDVMRASTCVLKTVACGYALSSACMIVANGDHGKRYAMPNAVLLLHEVSANFVGAYSEFKDMYTDIEETMDDWVSMLSEVTGKRKDAIRGAIKTDLYLKPEQAMKFGPKGIIDGIWPPTEED
jgi:ATP-dependent Clp protease protease subunit